MLDNVGILLGSPDFPISFQQHSSMSNSSQLHLISYTVKYWLAATRDYLPEQLQLGGRPITIIQS